MTNKYAHFLLRLLASLIDTFLFLALNIYLLWIIVQSINIPNLTYNLTLYLMVLLSPLGLLYQILFTYWFGATLGKMLTGIKISRTEGGKLDFKRTAFRQTIGYSFSWLFFGLGYIAILKDKERRAWHDKTVGSVVLQINNLWVLGMIALISLLGLNYYLGNQTVKAALTNEPLKNQIISIFNELKILNERNDDKLNESKIKPEKVLEEVLLAPQAPVTSAVPIKAEIDKELRYWNDELSFINNELGNLPTWKQSNKDQIKIDRMISIMTEQKNFAALARDKLVNKQRFTQADIENAENYVQLTEEYKVLLKEIFPN